MAKNSVMIDYENKWTIAMDELAKEYKEKRGKEYDEKRIAVEEHLRLKAVLDCLYLSMFNGVREMTGSNDVYTVRTRAIHDKLSVKNTVKCREELRRLVADILEELVKETLDNVDMGVSETVAGQEIGDILEKLSKVREGVAVHEHEHMPFAEYYKELSDQYTRLHKLSLFIDVKQTMNEIKDIFNKIMKEDGKGKEKGKGKGKGRQEEYNDRNFIRLRRVFYYDRNTPVEPLVSIKKDMQDMKEIKVLIG